MIRVLLSTPEPRDGVDNPYIRLFVDSLPPDVEVRFFSWTSFVLGRFDVFHVQWPEQLLRGRGRRRGMVRSVLLLVLLLRTRVLRRHIVRTVHNLTPHDGVDTALARFALDALDRRTEHWIYLNADTSVQHHEPASTILHGHYRDWFAARPLRDPEPGRLLFFGHLRRYKGVDALVRIAGELAEAGVRLHLAGRPADPALAAELTGTARETAVELTLRRVSEDELTGFITAAEAAILPYRDMYNSGALLLALSLDRPAIVPASLANRALADEVGPGWVAMYEGELTAAAVLDCLRQVRAVPRAPQPNLGARAWAELGERTAEIYRRLTAR